MKRDDDRIISLLSHHEDIFFLVGEFDITAFIYAALVHKRTANFPVISDRDYSCEKPENKYHDCNSKPLKDLDRKLSFLLSAYFILVRLMNSDVADPEDNRACDHDDVSAVDSQKEECDNRISR